MAKVLIFGTFDLLHEGHKELFKQAKEHGDVYAVIARDNTVKKIKGFQPKHTEQQRLTNVQNNKDITKAVLGNKNNYYTIIEEINPDIICLGYDQKEMNLAEELEKRNLKPTIIRLKPHHPDIYKSSLIKKMGTP